MELSTKEMNYPVPKEYNAGESALPQEYKNGASKYLFS